MALCTSNSIKQADLTLNILTTQAKWHYRKFYTVGLYTSIKYLFLHVLSHMSLDAQYMFGKRWY